MAPKGIFIFQRSIFRCKLLVSWRAQFLQYPTWIVQLAQGRRPFFYFNPTIRKCQGFQMCQDPPLNISQFQKQRGGNDVCRCRLHRPKRWPSTHVICFSLYGSFLANWRTTWDCDIERDINDMTTHSRFHGVLWKVEVCLKYQSKWRIIVVPFAQSII